MHLVIALLLATTRAGAAEPSPEHAAQAKKVLGVTVVIDKPRYADPLRSQLQNLATKMISKRLSVSRRKATPKLAT